MSLHRRNVLASLALLVPALSSMADSYPSRPIRMIVPFPPGGPVDLTARLIGKTLSETLGQPVVIENKSGAGGVVGTEQIAKAPADGYTIGMGTIASLGINPGLMERMPFGVPQDFTPITNASATSGVILATKDAPFDDLKGLVAYAKANPGKVTYASAGLGSVGHMVGESLNHAAGIRMTHVPYRGTTPAAQDLLAGSVTLFIETSLSTALTYLPTGKIKAIALTRKERSPLLPDVPGMREAGFPEIDSPAWFGVVGPAGLPPAVVEKLNKAIHASLQDKQITEQLAKFGAEPVPSSPEQFKTYIEQEIVRWKQVVKQANIKPM
ncbi:Bug family tripartite tricarboxylate transporter substrate binding protein [Hydrogenophaga sp. NFH-34]|uniref:Bug family tripartite tricarboxylate transporter substrate binding protein n=1 Tax=Hydrogenophaga sp. NFH-34 TaxID=2744446 RepID=UPI001F3616ED|nr:tripartite tricarboxylate transporter substrate binding protein [Hydrogenophaga sp. NFH-34]